MVNKTLLAQIKQRSDTATNWTTTDPVIGDGEIIIVETSAGEKRFKVGDGEKTFTQLPYADENILSKIKNYTAGDGISISNEGVISSTGGSGSSDVFVIEIDDDSENITTSFDDIKNAIQNHLGLISNFGSDTALLVGSYISDATTDHDEYIELICPLGFGYIVYVLLRAPGSTTVNQSHERFSTPYASWHNPPASGAAYWNATNKKWEIKDIVSGSDTFYLEMEVDGNGNITSLSKTFAEIQSAVESNKIMMVIVAGEGGFSTSACASNSSVILIYTTWIDDGKRLLFNINNDNTGNYQWVSIYTAGNGISISNNGTISVTASKIYSGTSNAPSADLGENGDIYIQTEG